MKSVLKEVELENSNHGGETVPGNSEGSPRTARTLPEIDHVLAQAHVLELAGQWEAAGQLYRQILTTDPSHAEANHRMGTVAQQLQVPALGLQYFEAALAIDPAKADYWIGYIEALFQAGQLQEARDVLALARQQGLEGNDVDALGKKIGVISPPPQANRARKGKSRKGKLPPESEFMAMVNCFNSGDHAGAEQMAHRMSRDYPDSWAGWKMLGVTLLHRGDNERAVEPLLRAATLAPNDAESQNNLGIALFHAGRIDDAVISYRHALQVDPNYAQGHCNLGAAFQAQGKLAIAEASYRRALEINPAYLKALNNLGSVLLDLKRFEDAETCYRQALHYKIADAESYRNLGAALNAAGRSEEAEADVRRAIELNPLDAASYVSLGAILITRGEPAEAELAFLRALEISPDLAEANDDLGTLLLEQQRLDEAETRLLKALEFRPDSFQAWNNLAICYKKQDRLADAERAVRRALDLRPDSTEALNNLGSLLRRLDRTEESEAVIRQALKLSDEVGLAHLNLGITLKTLDRLDEASACFERAAACGVPMAHFRKAMLLPAIMGTWDEVLASRQTFEAAVDGLLANPPAIEDPKDCFGEPNFYLAYHGMNDRELQIKVARLYAASCPALSWVAPHCLQLEPKGGRPLRIGFHSKYLFNHSVSTCYSRLLSGLSHQAGFDVSLISDTGVDQGIYDDFAGQIVTVPDSLMHAREAIAKLELDILVYLDIGMEPMSYFLAFSRLAPVQCVMAGHPVTTGIDTIDYFLSSAVFEAADADTHYSETLVRLPVPLVNYGRPEVPSGLKSRAALGLPSEGRIYMCPMKLQKLHPDFDAALARILELDEQGAVILFEDDKRKYWKHLIEARFEKTIAASLRKRIHFLPWLSDYKDFVAAVIHADVLLDPYHFGIGSTVVVVGVTGTPVVTRPGEFMRGRMGAYYNELLDIGECTVADNESYARKAVEIAGTPSLRSKLTANILRNGYRIYGDPLAQQELADFLADAAASASASTR